MRHNGSLGGVAANALQNSGGWVANGPFRCISNNEQYHWTCELECNNTSASGLVVGYTVAIDMTRVRLPAGAHFSRPVLSMHDVAGCMPAVSMLYHPTILELLLGLVQSMYVRITFSVSSSAGLEPRNS